MRIRREFPPGANRITLHAALADSAGQNETTRQSDVLITACWEACGSCYPDRVKSSGLRLAAEIQLQLGVLAPGLRIQLLIEQAGLDVVVVLVLAALVLDEVAAIW